MSSPSTPRTTLVLVHGAWHGPWCWDLLRTRSRDPADPAMIAVSLPSTAADVRALGRRADDVAVIRCTVERVDGPVVVVAHSAGGIPTSEALTGLADVAGVIYLGSYMLDAGQTAFDLHDTVPDWWDLHTDAGYLDPLRPGEVFYHDVEPRLRDWAIAQLRHQALDPTAQRSVAWHTVPSAYIVCDDDRALDPALQTAMAERADSVAHLPSGHSPFLSHPARLADTLHVQVDQLLRL